jgi:hypothetical protein
VLFRFFLRLAKAIAQKHLILERAFGPYPSVLIQQFTAAAPKRFLERPDLRAFLTDAT